MSKRNFLDDAFDIIFNEERIKLIRDITEGNNHILLFKSQDREELEKLGFIFYDIPTDDLCWDVELPSGWRNEVEVCSPTSYSIALIDEEENIRGVAYCYINGLNPVVNVEINSYKKKHN